jgi:hypothetical protein
MYVTFKNLLEQTKDNYEILYFFSNSGQYNLNVSDFYLEINSTFKKSYLFEGYLYNNNTYLITDLLAQDDNVVSVDYAFRHTLINEIMFGSPSTQNLNNHLSIGIHPMFHKDNENMVKVFMDNFIYKDSIKCLEHIRNFSKETVHNQVKTVPTEPIEKNITKGEYADVYLVFDPVSGNDEGILYVKGLKESSYLKSKSNHKVMCTFNANFNKWQPVMN